MCSIALHTLLKQRRARSHEARLLFLRENALCMTTRTKRPKDFARGPENGHADASANARGFRPRSNVTRAVCLEVASRNRLLSLCRKTGHALPDWNVSHDVENARWNAASGAQVKCAVTPHHMQRAALAPKRSEERGQSVVDGRVPVRVRHVRIVMV